MKRKLISLGKSILFAAFILTLAGVTYMLWTPEYSLTNLNQVKQEEIQPTILKYDTKVVFDGKLEYLDNPILTRDDVLFFPMPDLVRLMDGQYSTSELYMAGIGRTKDLVMEFYADTKVYFVDGEKRYLDETSLMYNGVVYIPLERVFTSIGLTLGWDDIDRLMIGYKTNISPETTALSNFLSVYGESYSVYYKNLETGYVYQYNADKLYSAASVIKAPYSLYLYQLAEQGKAKLNTEHNFTNAKWTQEWAIKGTGALKKIEKGVFTEHDLLKYAIRNSDNIAIQMLINKYGINGYKTFVASMGINPENVRSGQNARMSAAEAGIYAEAIYDYIEGGNTYSMQFKSDLMNTTNRMIKSSYPIARKYGWAANAFHDMAIVYSESPYVLVIFSDRAGSGEDFAAFRDISREIGRFNESNFVE